MVNLLVEHIDCPKSINLTGNYACLIIDGQALVYSLGKPKEFDTFGQLADRLKQSILVQWK